MTEVTEKELIEYQRLERFPIGDHTIQFYNDSTNKLIATVRDDVYTLPRGKDEKTRVLGFEKDITPEVMALYQFIYDYLHNVDISK